MDPVTFTWESPYATFHNNGVLMSDPNGAMPKWLHNFIEFVKHPFDKPARAHYRKSGLKKQGTGKVSSGGLANQSGIVPKNRIRVSVKSIITNAYFKGIIPTPGYYANGFPGASTPVTGRSSMFAARNARVGTNLTVRKSTVQLGERTEPDDFEVNGIKKDGAHDGGVTDTYISVNDGDDLSINATETPPSDPNGDWWDISDVKSKAAFYYGYTLWPISRPATPMEIALGEAGKLHVPYQSGRIQTGWQYAPPGVPGAKPLLKRPIGYIINYIFGGYNSVDKSK